MEEQYLKEQEKFTEKELGRAYWFVVNKEKLKKGGLIALAVVAGILFLYGAGGMLWFYAYQYNELVKLQVDVAAPKLNYSYLQEKNNPLPIEIGEARVLKTRADKFDVVVEVKNPNQSWYLSSFDFYFLVGNGSTEKKTGFLLPEENKYLMELNWASEENFSEAQIVLENLKWKKQTDFASLKEKILKIAVDKADFIPAQKLGLSEEVAVSQAVFTAKNIGAYNFSRVDFSVLLFRGGSLVGATRTAIEPFSSGEESDVKVNFYHPVGSVDSILVAPEVDILNSDSFMAFEKTTGQVK